MSINARTFRQCLKVFSINLISERFYSIYQHSMNLCKILHCMYHTQSQKKTLNMILCREGTDKQEINKSKSHQLELISSCSHVSLISISHDTSSLTRSHERSLLPALDHHCHSLSWLLCSSYCFSHEWTQQLNIWFLCSHVRLHSSPSSFPPFILPRVLTLQNENRISVTHVCP